MTTINLGSLKVIGNPSGYLYLYLPQHIRKQFEIEHSDVFIASYSDGKLILVQADKNKNGPIKKEE